MEWRFTLTSELDVPESGSVEVMGINVSVNLAGGAVKTAVIEGGISFDCRTPPFLVDNACYCLIYDLHRIEPQIVTPFSINYSNDLSAVQDKIDAIIPGASLTVEDPKIVLTPRMEMTSTDAGKCALVHVEAELDVIPGTLTVKLPKIPLPPPLPSIDFPPFEYVLGEATHSIVRTDYKICCCSWDMDAPVKEPDPEFINEELSDPRRVFLKASEMKGYCSCDDVEGDKDYSADSINPLTEITQPDPTKVTWEITALEGPCKYKMVWWGRSAEGNWVRLKQADKAPSKRRSSP